MGTINFGQLRRLYPVSREFGYDRGTPVDRYYIEKFLAENADAMRGRVLEVGDDSYTRRFGGARVERRDVLHVDPSNPAATVVGDLATGENLPCNTFDCFIMSQTLHLIYDARAALRTVYRILKPGGVLLATFPGISQTSIDQWAERWCWSFTGHSAARLFREVFPPELFLLRAYGNPLATAAFLQGLAVSELTPGELDRQDSACEMLLAVRAVKPRID